MLLCHVNFYLTSDYLEMYLIRQIQNLLNIKPNLSFTSFIAKCNLHTFNLPNLLIYNQPTVFNMYIHILKEHIFSDAVNKLLVTP